MGFYLTCFVLCLMFALFFVGCVVSVPYVCWVFVDAVLYCINAFSNVVGFVLDWFHIAFSNIVSFVSAMLSVLD